MAKTINFKALAMHPLVGPAFLIACFVGFSARFFLADGYLPLHDTGDTLHVFKTTYSNFMFNGTLPEWLPYGAYGYPTHLQNVIGLSPFAYPAMLVGKLFGVLDTLALFRLVIFAEVIVFAVGLLRLADEIFENRAISLFVLAAALMSTLFITQIYFSFRLVYLLPLLTFHILRFAKTGWAGHAVIGAILVLAAAFGGLFYFPILSTLYGGLLFVLFLMIYGKDFRLVIDRLTIAIFAVALVFFTIGVQQVLSSIDQLQFVIPDRDPETLKVELDTFLGHGSGGLVKILDMVLGFPVNSRDTFFTVPAAALIFALYAVARERGGVFLVVAAVFAFFLVLTWGRYSPLAYIIYYIPGGSFIRHLGILHAIPKVLLCVIAGFGVRHFLAAADDADSRERRFLTKTASLLAFSVSMVLIVAVLMGDDRTLSADKVRLVGLSAAGFAAVAVVSAISSIRGKAFIFAMAGLIVVQGGAFLMAANAMLTDGYQVTAAVKQEVVRARPYVFEETRLPVSGHRKFEAWDRTSQGLYYYHSHTILYQVLGIDPCTPEFPRNTVDNYSPHVHALAGQLLGKGVDVRDFANAYKKNPDNLFFRLAGCGGRAKLQLITRFEDEVLDGDPNTDLGAAMESGVVIEGGGERRLIRSVAGEYPNGASLSAQGLTVTHFSANRLQLSVQGTGEKGAWLVYADAYHPGWRAAVDGSPAKVWKANTAFKAVYLKPGAKTVSFDITDAKWQAAMWFIALFAAAAIILSTAPGIIGLFRRGKFPMSETNES